MGPAIRRRLAIGRALLSRGGGEEGSGRVGGGDGGRGRLSIVGMANNNYVIRVLLRHHVTCLEY